MKVTNADERGPERQRQNVPGKTDDAPDDEVDVNSSGSHPDRGTAAAV